MKRIYFRSLPDWTKKVYPDGDMQWISYHAFAVKTITPKLARIQSGFLLKDMLDRFDNKTRSLLSPDRSMWVYSAHDTTVASLLNTLGLFEVRFCNYIISLYKNIFLIAP